MVHRITIGKVLKYLIITVSLAILAYTLYVAAGFIYARIYYAPSPVSEVSSLEEMKQLVEPHGFVLPENYLKAQNCTFTVYRETQDRRSKVIGYAIHANLGTPEEITLSASHEKSAGVRFGEIIIDGQTVYQRDDASVVELNSKFYTLSYYRSLGGEAEKILKELISRSK